MQFGIHLVERDVITAGQFVTALKQQLEERPPLGQLAIEQGKLSVRDVFRVLRFQSDIVRGQFGETAINLDLLDEKGVAELLYEQSNRTRTIGDILLEQGALTPSQYERELASFRRGAERAGTTGEHPAEREVELMTLR